MEDLDLLKKDWKRNENSFEQVSENEIYKMLHKQSSSIVKYILVISIIEFSLWTMLGFFNSTDEYMKKLNQQDILIYFSIFDYSNYAVILCFIFLFYKNYQNISVSDSTKDLMNDILKTRRTVKYYIWYNLFMIIVSFIVGFIIAFTLSPEVADLNNKIHNNNKLMAMIIGMFSVCVIAVVVLFWLFYRLVYGLLLKKLRSNYEDLKRIDL